MSSLRNVSIFILILLIGCGCFGGHSDEQYIHKELEVSLRLPDGWERAYASPMETASSMAFADGKGGKILLVHNPGVTLRKQMDIVSEVYYPILQKGALFFPKYKTKWFLSNQDRVTNITYVIQDAEGRIFSLICTAESLNFVTYRRTFDRIARSFRSFYKGF